MDKNAIQYVLDAALDPVEPTKAELDDLRDFMRSAAGYMRKGFSVELSFMAAQNVRIAKILARLNGEGAN